MDGGDCRGREILVTALRGFIEQSGGDFSAKMAGKLKMVIQCVAVVASLVVLSIRGTRRPHVDSVDAGNRGVGGRALHDLLRRRVRESGGKYFR